MDDNPAKNGCTCPCHSYPAMAHIQPCCPPADGDAFRREINDFYRDFAAKGGAIRDPDADMPIPDFPIHDGIWPTARPRNEGE